MDVKKSQNSKSKFPSKIYVGIGFICSLLILIVLLQGHKGGESVSRKNILLGTVSRGDLVIEVEGYGTLRSDNLQLLTTLTRSTVKKILLKPGAIIKNDSVIVELDNPELRQQVSIAEQELIAARANLRQLKVNNRRELLTAQSERQKLESEYKSERLLSDAQETIVASGVVSKIEFERGKLKVNQIKDAIDIEYRREKHLKEFHDESVNIELEKVKQSEAQLSIARSRLDSLFVVAGMDSGVVQRLLVEIGQSLEAGQEVGLVGSTSDLIALVRIPQSKGNLIKIGQSVVIDNRQDKMVGVVSRIDPRVEDNSINIEIQLPKDLPQSARPEMPVDATIIVETLKNVNYVAHPSNTNENSHVNLFKLDESQKEASKVEVQFGKEGGRFIQVISGLEEYDKIILSGDFNTDNSKVYIGD